MQSLLDRISGRERLRIVCALAFWAATYLLFLTWNQLQDEFPSAIWQSRRLLTTLWGAVLFFGFTRLADRVASRRLRYRALVLVGSALVCCAAMVAGRTAIDEAISQLAGDAGSTLPRNLRFTLVWVGYFAGGAMAFLSFAPAAAGADKSETDAADAPESPVTNDNSFPDALWVSRGRETARVPIEAIDWIEAEGDYVRLHARTGGGLMRGTLTSLEARLDPRVFARVHRSAICRRSAIAAMLRKPSGAMAVRLDNGAEVPVGRRYRDSVAALLGPTKDVPRRVSA
jgi:hypothetical protein